MPLLKANGKLHENHFWRKTYLTHYYYLNIHKNSNLSNKQNKFLFEKKNF